MSTRNKIILFVVCLVALFAFQAKVIVPMLYDIAQSGLFLEDSGDEPSLTAVSTEMTNYAFEQCNAYIADELGTDFSVSFSTEPINAWTIGNYQYVINADVQIIPPEGASAAARYVCRIKYDNKDDMNGVQDLENWSVDGLGGLDAYL